MKTFWNIIKSILVFPFALAGAVCMIPLAAIYFLVAIPVVAIESVWHDDIEKELY